MSDRPAGEAAGPLPPSSAASVRILFCVGPRTLWSVERRLVRISMPLESRASWPELPPLVQGADGYLVTGLRADFHAALADAHPALRPFVRNHYPRSYASLQDGFDAYLGRFSAKTRSTLKRKVRKLVERSGGQLDLRSYSRPDQIDDFYRHARAVSATTYQERLLKAGLPEGEGALAAMRELAGRDAMRGWILFVNQRPISYLYAPAAGDTLLYAHLGYDPEWADLSPGTVLQIEAMRALMAERRFRTFDFTEGDGQHKRQFATGAIDCVDLLLLRPTPSNHLLGHGLAAFDATVASAKRLLPAARLRKLARAVRH